jgi:hypothetical protein
MVVAGPPASGKSRLVMGLVERACALGYQVCVIDTRGRYLDFAAAVAIGAERAPDALEVVTALEKPALHAVVSLERVPRDERAGFIAGLLRRLGALQESTGRPHWIVVDEAAHALPPRGLKDEVALAPAENTLHVSAEARRLPAELLAAANAIVASGEAAGAELAAIADALAVPAPPEPIREPRGGEALVWSRRSGAAPVLVQLDLPQRRREDERSVGRLLRRA